MVRRPLFAVLLACLTMLPPAIAQRGGNPSKDAARPNARPGGGDQLLQPGTMLPTVTAVDEQGNKFSTASLRGNYTVLVFGCLT